MEFVIHIDITTMKKNMHVDFSIHFVSPIEFLISILLLFKNKIVPSLNFLSLLHTKTKAWHTIYEHT